LQKPNTARLLCYGSDNPRTQASTQYVLYRPTYSYTGVFTTRCRRQTTEIYNVVLKIQWDQRLKIWQHWQPFYSTS